MRARFACILLWLAGAAAVMGAELQSRTAAAYEKYIAEFQQAFIQHSNSEAFLEHASPSQMERLRRGEILWSPGKDSGIMEVPDGLIHHWRAAIYVPGVTLAAVLDKARDYSNYHTVYTWVIGSELIAHEGDRSRSFFRMKRSAGAVTGVLDLWIVTDYRSIRADRATSIANVECVRQVEHAGERRERRLPRGTGNGYLWRANTLSKYLERDGGVYIELDTLGLTRDFPPLLKWVIEPVARRLGRASAADSLRSLNRAVTVPKLSVGEPRTVERSRSWCGD